MSRKLGGRDPPPYKYATRKALDHHMDRMMVKLERLQKDIKTLKGNIGHIILFLQEGPHSSAYAIFMDRLQEEAENRKI